MTTYAPYHSFLYLDEDDLNEGERAYSLQPPPVSVCVSLVVSCHLVDNVWIDPSNVGLRKHLRVFQYPIPRHNRKKIVKSDVLLCFRPLYSHEGGGPRMKRSTRVNSTVANFRLPP